LATWRATVAIVAICSLVLASCSGATTPSPAASAGATATATPRIAATATPGTAATGTPAPAATPTPVPSVTATPVPVVTASQAATPQAGPILVGASLSLSGEFSDQGKVVQQGYELWAEYVNKNGGLMGRQVELKILSDGSSPEQIVTNYEQLITRDKVDLLLGPFSTGLSKPASVVAHRHGYAFFSGLAGGPEIVEQGFPEVLNVALDGSKLFDGVATWALGQKDPPKSVAYLVLDNDFTIPIAASAKKVFEAGGAATVVDELYPPKFQGFAALARKVSDSKADVVFLGSAFDETIAFIQAFVQQKYDPKAVLAVQGPDFGGAFPKAVGEANARGVLGEATWHIDLKTPLNKEFVDMFVAKYGGAPTDIVDFSAMAFATGQVIAQVVEAAGSLDQAALIQAAHAGRFETITGPVQLDKTGLNTAATGITLQWQDGAAVIVLPEGVAAKPLLYPKPVWGQ
jgi:branched-chain amino acid transport system substrate-binding protein